MSCLIVALVLAACVIAYCMLCRSEPKPFRIEADPETERDNKKVELPPYDKGVDDSRENTFEAKCDMPSAGIDTTPVFAPR